MKQCSRILDIKFYPEEEQSLGQIVLLAHKDEKCNIGKFFFKTIINAPEDIYELSFDTNFLARHIETESSIKQYYHLIKRNDKFYNMSRIEYITADFKTHITYFEDEAKAEESFNELMENNKSNLINIASMDDYLNYNSTLKKEDKK